MTFSYSAVWEDTVRMLRSHSSLIAAIAGVFIFLPTLLTGHFLPWPEAEADQMLAEFGRYMSTNIHWLLLARLVEMVGTIAILLLIFGGTQTTVGAAIGRAVALLPFYFAASLISGLMISVGLFLLLIPGLYLLGRLAVVGVVVVAEARRNPIDAIRRSFELTRGRGWVVLGLVLIVVIAGVICIGALTAVIGAILILIAGQDIGALLVLIVSSLASAVLAVVLTLLTAAIYRQLVPQD
jgi:hypothetical protein